LRVAVQFRKAQTDIGVGDVTAAFHEPIHHVTQPPPQCELPVVRQKNNQPEQDQSGTGEPVSRLQ